MSDLYTRYQTSDSRGMSNSIWNNCPRAQILTGHLDRGWGFIDDFTSLDTTNTWTVTQAGSAGTMALADAKGGVVIINSGHTDAGDGANCQRSVSGVGESFNCQYGTVYYECLVYLTSCATADLFIGLAPIDTTLVTSAPAISTTTVVGFWSLTRDGVVLSGTYNTTAATGTGLTLVASTWYKLGFKVTGSSKAEFFVDGALVNTETTYIPTTELVPTFVVQSGGTNQPVLYCDWLSVFQAETLERSTV